jgi:hypothetical protein
MGKWPLAEPSKKGREEKGGRDPVMKGSSGWGRMVLASV